MQELQVLMIKDFLNKEFAFRYGIWEFLIHDLIPETQFLAAIGYGTDLKDQSHVPTLYHI